LQALEDMLKYVTKSDEQKAKDKEELSNLIYFQEEAVRTLQSPIITHSPDPLLAPCSYPTQTL
jgi:hypothetical protein